MNLPVITLKHSLLVRLTRGSGRFPPWIPGPASDQGLGLHAYVMSLNDSPDKCPDGNNEIRDRVLRAAETIAQVLRTHSLVWNTTTHFQGSGGRTTCTGAQMPMLGSTA